MRKRLIRATIFSMAITLLVGGVFTMYAMGMITVAVTGEDLSYRTLDYDATITRGGDLKVTQHIDMKLLKRDDDNGDTKPWKQLYQQYTLRTGNLTDISDITVRNVTEGVTYQQQSEPKLPDAVASDAIWDSDYADHWYIADVTGGTNAARPYTPGTDALDVTAYGTDAASKTVEIGWNIPATVSADSMKFDVSFTMHNVAAQWDDIASFQWEPLGKSNAVPIGTVSGTVHFPDSITADTSWAWLHTERTSETSRAADGSLKFKAYNVRSGDYLDVVAAFKAGPKDTGINAARYQSGDHLDTLKHSEYQQEQQWRDKQRTMARIRLGIWIAIVLFGLIFCAWGIAAVITSNKNTKYRGPIEYWRDQPGISPASAARLIDVVESPKHSRPMNRELTATMLSLAVKKAVAIYPGPADMYRGIDMSKATPVSLSHMIDGDSGRRRAARFTSTIVILPSAIDGVPNAEQLGLSESENALLNLLIVISERVGSPVFDFGQMKQACKDWEDGYVELGKFTGACDIEYARLNASRSRRWQSITAGAFAAVIGYGSMIGNTDIGYAAVGIILGLPLILVGLFCALAGATHELTEQGQEIAGKCLGLKHYMQDFSSFTDRGTADLAMWDWYMVYAAAFGISDRVAAELAKAYPQVADPRWLDDNASDSTLYWSYRSHSWNDDARYGYGAQGSTQNVGGGLAGQFGANSMFGGSSYVPSLSFSDLGSQLSSGFADITSTISAAAPSSSDGSSGGFSGGGFGGSSGGSGGGSFGGR
ncbi:DUF2207 domain-containing protein [Bifidobacterium olomucense]|uniref:DUF2207 domain-containing protein n=1 Tax=Bifidobacterium olomucense TaxID=2675324 RepID=A0A7Y0EYZ3_9BIFI|nr:DUF2207 domain-containing protein [Bifidobacterium sp. DSM 109959]NMM98963.1 hypothetical protein [Bifidobacterium sp. DSM 109959]